jgi:hypothetical protein
MGSSAQLDLEFMNLNLLPSLSSEVCRQRPAQSTRGCTVIDLQAECTVQYTVYTPALVKWCCITAEAESSFLDLVLVFSMS